MARIERARVRLDQPRVPGRTLRPSVDPETFGRVSERIARFLGTSRFLAYMTVFILLWLVWNTVAPESSRFDPYTFTFLTLLLSLQASYAAPLILLAQNRQDDRDRVNLAQDRDQNARLLADTEYLTREVASLRVSLGDVVTRDYLRAELRAFLEELDEADEGRSERSREKRADKSRSDKQREKSRSEKSRSDRARADKRADKPRADQTGSGSTAPDRHQLDQPQLDRPQLDQPQLDRGEKPVRP